jgi:hypothetical protein
VPLQWEKNSIKGTSRVIRGVGTPTGESPLLSPPGFRVGFLRSGFS